MNTRKITFLLLILSLVGWGVAIFLLKFYDCGNSIFCYNLTTTSFSLYYGMLALAFVFLVLTFIPKAFPAWKKFARWFIPIAVVIFIFYPDPGSGDYFSPYPEQVFQWISTLYVLISILIIFGSLFRNKRIK